MDDLPPSARIEGACQERGEGDAGRFHQAHQRGEDEDERTLSFLKLYFVFNVSQIEGLADESIPLSEPIVGYDAVDRFIAATNADIRHGGNVAAYHTAIDFISMPPLGAFDHPSSYYATVLHELGHWSGPKRLDRDLKDRFGMTSYAVEELIAELTAAFLCAHLGVVGELRHADYMAHWIALMHQDKRAFFMASSKASKAANYLRSLSETLEEAA